MNLARHLIAAIAILAVTMVQAAPVIQTNPTNQTVINGGTATFTAASSTSGATVIWQQKPTGTTTFTTIAGETSTSLVVTASNSTSTGNNGTQYQAVFTNPADSTTATTTAATLTVTDTTPAAPAIVTQPQSLTRIAGDPVAFFASASGTPTPTVQWQISTNGGTTFTNVTGSRFTGATSNVLQFTSALTDNGAQFQAVYTNSISSVTTTTAKLTVTSATTPTPETPQGTNTQGVLVYGLNFKHLAGFGIDFFEDGYVVAPATGGTGEVLFLGRDHGKRIYSHQTGVKFFPAYTRDDKFTVVTMTGSASASLSMNAYGKADDKVKAKTPNVSITVNAARTMHGLAQAALDESTSTTKATDGTSGFVEFSEMKLAIDDGETSDANDKSLSVADTMKALITKATRRGYSELKLTTTTTTTDGSTTNNGTTTNGTTTNGTTTTTN
jgi:hypothetical protein